MYLYCIKNLKNGKQFVNITDDLKKECDECKKELDKNSHENKHLQESWNKWGSWNFTIEILEILDTLEEAKMATEQYIELNNLYDNKYGYNIKKKVEIEEKAPKNKHFEDQAVICMNIKNNKKKIYNKITDAGTDGFNVYNIDSCCQLRQYRSENRIVKSISHKDHVWMYLKDYKKDFDELDKRCKRSTNGMIRRGMYPSVIGKNITNGNLIKYKFLNDVRKDGFKTWRIRECCMHTSKTYKGYVWIFEEDLGILDSKFNRILFNQ